MSDYRSEGQVRLDGAPRLRRTLRKAGDDLADLKATHASAAAIAADASADLAPERTGRLKKTIRSAGTKTAGIIRAGNNTRVVYAGPIHWGWFKRHVTPALFLSRGARDSEGRWLPVYENYVHTTLNNIEGI